jgi:hypothetical protein
MLRFTIRDLLWMTVVVALAAVLWRERALLNSERAKLQAEHAKLVSNWQGLKEFAVEVRRRERDLKRQESANAITHPLDVVRLLQHQAGGPKGARDPSSDHSPFGSPESLNASRRRELQKQSTSDASSR